MAPLIYPATKLDSDQVIQYVYDEATQTLRTTATAVIVGQPIEVEIDMATDSIKLGDGTTLFTSTTVGPKTGLDVSIINTIPISGSITVTNFPTTVDTNYGVVGASTLRTASQIGNATGAADFGAGATSTQTLRVVLPTDQSAIPVTQSGTWNINNISGTISLPTGASTSALQTTGNTSLASIVTNTNSLNLGQGSTTSGQTGNLVMGAVTTAAPTYTTGQTDPLSLTTTGSLRVDGSGSTQPVSGTVAATQSGTWNIGTVTTITNPVAVTQSTSPWVVSGTVTANEDKNYGTVGANTLRTAAQIGNSTGQADFNAGTTSAQTLRVVLPTNQSSIPVTQSGAWTVSSTQGTSPWVVSGTVTANQGTSALPGNAWYTRITDGTVTVGVDPTTFSLNTNIVNPTNFGALSAAVRTAAIVGNATGAALFGAGTTTAQVLRVVLPTDQTAIPVTQSTSPWVISGTTTAAEDKNYGTVGATTLRTAAQIGNATGAALFGAGTTTAQVLRVVLPTDQSAIPVTQSTSPWVISGPAASGAAKSGNPVQSGAVFNTTQPTVTTGQVVENQATARGALIVATGVDNFNINNISGTISLPTGAATEASLAKLTQTQGSTTSGQSGPLILGAVTTASPTYTTAQSSPLSLDTSGSLRVTGGQVADKTTFTYGTTNFANIGGVFQDTSPSLTAGQSGVVRLTANRAEHVNLRDASGNELLGQKTMANSLPVVLASDQTSLPVTVGPIIRASYSGSSTTGFSADPLGGTDIFTLGGSATKTVRVVRLIITATRTTSSNIDIALVRRSTVNSGGVGFPLTSVTHDTTNAAATTQPIEYTTNPTLGTLVGYIRAQKMFINAPATGASDVIRWDFSDLPEQAIVLRGTSQVLAVNLSGVVITGSAFCISIDWTEE